MEFVYKSESIRASDVGAPHGRDRWFALAERKGLLPHADPCGTGRREQQQEGAQEAAGSICHAAGAGLSQRAGKPLGRPGAEPELERSDYEVPNPASIGQQGQGMPFNASDSAAYSGRKAGNAIHDGERREWPPEPGICRVADELSDRMDNDRLAHNTKENREGSSGGNAVPNWWQVEADIPRVADGIPNRVGALKGLGNAQVPIQAATAWRILTHNVEKGQA